MDKMLTGLAAPNAPAPSNPNCGAATDRAAYRSAGSDSDDLAIDEDVVGVTDATVEPRPATEDVSAAVTARPKRPQHVVAPVTAQDVVAPPSGEEVVSGPGEKHVVVPGSDEPDATHGA